MIRSCSNPVEEARSFFQIKSVAAVLLVTLVAATIIGAAALAYPHSFVGHMVGNGVGIALTIGGTSAFTALLINLFCSCPRTVVKPTTGKQTTPLPQSSVSKEANKLFPDD